MVLHHGADVYDRNEEMHGYSSLCYGGVVIVFGPFNWYTVGLLIATKRRL